MYAKNLSLLLHSQLSEDSSYDQTLTRFEALRGYNQLPRGRENAGQRLSNEQVARAVLGFAPSLCRWAGHARHSLRTEASGAPQISDHVLSRHAGNAGTSWSRILLESSSSLVFSVQDLGSSSVAELVCVGIRRIPEGIAGTLV